MKFKIDKFLKNLEIIDKTLENKNAYQITDKLNQVELDSLKIFFINFIFYLSQRETDSFRKAYLAKVSYCMYINYLMLKLQNNDNSKMKGGRPIRVVRNGKIMTIDENELQDGDDLSFVVGFNQGGLVGDLANHNLELVSSGKRAEPPTVQVMERYVNEHPTPIVQYETDFEKKVREQNEKTYLKILQKRENIVDEKISIAAHSRIMGMSAGAGFTCCICLGVAEQLTYNLVNNTGAVAKAAVVGAKDVVVDAAEAAVNLIPQVDGFTAFGNFIYGVSVVGSQYSKDFFESITPSMPSTMIQKPIEIIKPGEITTAQINYFDAIMQNCKRSDVQCGISIAVATCCYCYNLETKELKRRADTLTIGPQFQEYDKKKVQLENNNFARNVIKAGGVIATVAGNPVLGSTISAASRMFKDDNPNQSRLGYGQIQNPSPTTIGTIPDIEEIKDLPTPNVTNTTVRRRIPYSQITNGGKRRKTKGKNKTYKKSNQKSKKEKK